MDRCHRIGQTKPVHVYRLATAQSIEVACSRILSFWSVHIHDTIHQYSITFEELSQQGRILKRAFSKLKLEHVVIEKGQFHQERTKPNSGAIVKVS